MLTLSAATGFDLEAFDSPEDITAPSDFLCHRIRLSKFGRMPSTDLHTPTCSAVLVKEILVELISRGDKDIKYSLRNDNDVGIYTCSLVFSGTNSTMYFLH